MGKSRPNVFIASSVEGLKVADAINANLDHETYPTMWRAGTFRLGSNTIDDLVKKSSSVDFAIFVFTPDDAATIRDKSEQVVRDNVLFELGLFIGALGKERCYIVRPRGSDMHLPSDLLGIVTADYESNRPDNDLDSALNAPCRLIKEEIARHGPIAISLKGTVMPRHVPNPPEYTLNDLDLHFLAECAASHTSSPHGLSFHFLSNRFSAHDSQLRLSAIKLMRLGYIEKIVDESEQEPFYAYLITDAGLDTYVKNEDVFQPKNNSKSQTRSAAKFADMEDDIPF